MSEVMSDSKTFTVDCHAAFTNWLSLQNSHTFYSPAEPLSKGWNQKCPKHFYLRSRTSTPSTLRSFATRAKPLSDFKLLKLAAYSRMFGQICISRKRILPGWNKVVLLMLCILCLIRQIGSAKSYDFSEDNQQDLMHKFMKHVKLHEFPTFTREEYDSFVVPPHIRQKYDALVWKSSIKQGCKQILSRKKRSPSLDDLFKSVHQNPSIAGNIIYTDSFREKLQFDMENKIPEGSRITKAELRLFKKLPNFSSRLSSNSRFRSDSSNNNLLRRNPARWRPSKVHHARVSVYHTLTHNNDEEESLLVDSRMIEVNGSGWESFDVKSAVKQWQKHPVKYMLITLELRIESSRPGHAAAEVARMVRFTGQGVASNSPRRPELLVFTEEKTKSIDCESNPRNKHQKCCRLRHYINFRQMAWSQYLVVEPVGYNAYKCVGRCSASHRKTSRGASRSCAVAESKSLPVIYLVKRENSTEIEITELPDGIVQKCGCSLDSLSTE